jgi:hypothetical protein
VYLHDLARTHDGRCPEHGGWAWTRLQDLPDVRERLVRGGVRPEDWPAVEAAVTVHSCGELPAEDPHWRLAALLKDGDALDRVRLGDLKAKWLRHPEAVAMVPFASSLFEWSSDHLVPGADYFPRLWTAATAHLDTGHWPVS